MFNMYKSQAALSVEFVRNGKYFRTINPDEIAKLESGQIAGWTRTHNDFNVIKPDASVAFAHPVARFWSQQKDSHFFTANPEEAETILRLWSDVWTLETPNAFQVFTEDMDKCAVVERYWNGRDNHRYVVHGNPVSWAGDPAAWTAEGPVFFVPLEEGVTEDGTGEAPPIPPVDTPSFTYSEPSESIIRPVSGWGWQYRDAFQNTLINVFPFTVPVDESLAGKKVSISLAEFQSVPTYRQCNISEVAGDLKGTQGQTWRGASGNTCIAEAEVGKDLSYGRTYFFNAVAWSPDIGATGTEPVVNVTCGGGWGV